MPQQVLKIQKEAVARYQRIANLWVAYYVHGEDPLEFGREFYQAVGDLLEGNPIKKLTLHHINTKDVQSVVFTGRVNSDDKREEAGEQAEQRNSVVGCKSSGESQGDRPGRK